MKHLRFLLCLALAVTLLTACGPKGDGSASSSGGGSSVSSSGSGSDPEPAPAPASLTLAACLSDSFHPVLGTNRSNLTLAPLLYEPLFQLDETFQPVPVLCSQAASADGLIWELTLREGITFSDGSPLTGSVVADALNTARQSTRYAQRLRDVSSFSGQGNVVTVTLVRANGNLPALLDIPIASGTGDRPVGTGPYVLSETDGGLALAARSGWWQGKTLPVQTIRLTAASRSEDLVSSFSAGDIGLVDVDLMGTNAPGYSGSYQTWDYATTELLYLGLNTQSGLCRAPEVRQAIARAIDRTSIVQVDFARHAVAAGLPVHPSSPLYNAAQAGTLGYSPQQSQAALEQLRLTGRSVTLVVNTENTAKVSAAQRIAAQLEAVGLTVHLSRLSYDSYVSALAAGNFDLYLGQVTLTGDFDLAPLLSSSGSLNYGRWQDALGDALLSAFQSAQGEARTKAAADLFAYLNQQAPIVPVCFKNGSVLTQWSRLSGLSPVRGNVFYQLENWKLS